MPGTANYDAIKALMNATPPKAMLAKYDKDGDGTDPQGSRKLWPMVLGYSPDTEVEGESVDMVLCYQTTGAQSDRGWRCMKVDLLSSISQTNANVPRPIMTEDQVNRQSCVVSVELPVFAR